MRDQSNYRKLMVECGIQVNHRIARQPFRFLRACELRALWWAGNPVVPNALGEAQADNKRMKVLALQYPVAAPAHNSE